jgi:1,2-diacylglycerol 3-beta-glucosyltransferase
MAATAVCGLFLLPATAAVGYYLLLTLLGRFPRRAAPPANRPRLTVLIPAHDEQAGLPATLASVFAAEYPADRFRVLVVADNCADDTAGVARRCGAEVVERIDATRRSKGHAVAFGLTHALADRPDAVLVLDADCTIDPHLLNRVGAELAQGMNAADAVQAAVVSQSDSTSPGGYVAAVGAAIDHAVAAGRDRLGLGVPLRGTGMAFRRELLERHPWAVESVTEDAEYADLLRRNGVRVRYVPDAEVSCRAPDRLGDFLTQRRRWRAALRTSGWSMLTASKPLVLSHLLLTVAATAAFAPHLLAWVGGLVALTGVLYGRAVLEVGVPRIGLLTRSIGVVARLGVLTIGGFWEREHEWHRTPRS